MIAEEKTESLAYHTGTNDNDGPFFLLERYVGMVKWSELVLCQIGCRQSFIDLSRCGSHFVQGMQ